MWIKTATWSFVTIFCISFSSISQVIDDFSDGDLSLNPAWTGSTGNFSFNATEGKLQSQGPTATATYFISTPNKFIHETSWEFNVQLNFDPSTSNYMDIFLVSDQEDLTGNLNGYFIRIGDSGSTDGIDLYRQEGSSTVRIADGPDGQVASSPNVSLKVSRNATGDWEVWADLLGGTNFSSEILTASDDTFQSTNFFGFVVHQTSTRNDDFYFGSPKITAKLLIESVEVTSKNNLKILFNQPITDASGSESSNFIISNSIPIIAINRSADNSSQVELTSGDLTTNAYSLTASNLIKEQTGTPQETIEPFSFSYIQLALSQIITPSSTEVKILFNDEVDLTVAETPSNYTINGGIGTPASAVLNASDPQEVVLTLATELSEQAYELNFLNSLPNASGNSQIELGASYDFDFVVPLIAESVTVLSKNQLLVIFNKDLAVGPAETPENYSINNSVGTPLTAALGDAPYEVVLTLGQTLAGDSYEISISNLTDAAAVTLSTNPTTLGFSYLPLTIENISVTGENTLALNFNQVVGQSSAEHVANYYLNDNFGNPQTASLSLSDDKVVELIFAKNFLNYTYELTVSGVSNSTGNATAENIVEPVAVSKATPAGALIVTEVFADPNPKGISPEPLVLPTASGAEFVEIYNPGNRSIDLTGFTLSGGTFGTHSLAGGAYVALVPASYLQDYQALGSAVGVASWNSLTNSGETVTLKDQLGNTIDEVSFSDSWNDDSEKEGGWSLEKIHPQPVCESSANWRSSVAEKGATPGAQNSVFDNTPDTTSPTVKEVEIVSPESLAIHFSEKMTADLAGAVVLLNGEAVASSTFSGDFTLVVSLYVPLLSEADYILKLEGLSDCSGNVLASNQTSFYYDTKPPVLDKLVLRSFKSLLLSFDEPLKETDAEKEENYKITGLEAFPAKSTLTTESLSEVLLEFEESFALGADYEIEVSNLKDTLGNVMASTAVASFFVQQHIDSAWAEGPNFLTIAYTKSPATGAMLSAENYVLEGKLPPLKVIAIDTLKARLIFSNNFAENKDLVLSVSNLVDANDIQLITPDYTFRYDTKPPSIDSIVVTDARHLLVYFDEALEDSYAEANGNYDWKDHGHPDAVLLQPNKKSVLLTFEESFPQEVDQELAVINLKDIFGNQITKAARKTFVYDTLAPRVISVIVTAPNMVEVYFSEPVTSESSDTLSHYVLANFNPATAKRMLPDSNVVALTFAEPLPDVNSMPLLIEGISDFRHNVSNSTNITVDNEDLRPGKAIAIADNKVSISFNKPLSDNLLMANIAGENIVSVKNGNRPHLMEVEMSTSLKEDGVYTYAFNGLISAQGITLGTVKAVSFTYRSQVEQLTSRHPVLAELLLSVPVHADSLVAVTSMTLHPGEIIPSLILQDADNPNKVNVYFDQNLPSDKDLILSFSNLYDKWDRKIPDQSIPFSIDAQAPTILKVDPRLFSELIVEFSEKVSSSTALSTNHYSLLGIGEPEKIELLGSGQLAVSLTFENEFVDQATYNLSVKRVEDISGNVIQTDTIAFTYSRPDIPSTGEVLITEIMADPSPSAGLPEVEYVEIFNNSGKELDLTTLRFVNSDKMFELGQGKLPAGSYFILCSTSDAASLSPFGSTIGLTSWSALSNGGDSLSLINYSGDLIDQAVYNSSWYKDTQKDEGGYSLEKILGESPCGEDYRWGASISEIGGTPGSANSLTFAEIDSVAPELLSIGVVEATKLSLSFSEWISEIGLAGLQVSVNGQDNIDSFTLEDNPTKIIAVLKQPLMLGAEYLITISGLSDCSGNTMELTELKVGVGRSPSFGELIISELMPDPDPSQGLPEAEYIEVLNVSSDWISLEAVSLMVGDKKVAFPNSALAPNTYLILSSSGNLPLLKKFGATLSLPSFPALKNDGDEISLFAGDELLHSSQYDDGLFREADKRDGGWSLEIIDAALPCAGKENWTASIAEHGGTPGQVNSVNGTLGDGMPVSLLEVIHLSDSTLHARLSEQVTIDISKLEVNITPSLGELGIQSDFFTDNFIIQFQESVRPGIFYEVTVSGLVDCRGNLSTEEQLSTNFILPSPSDSLDVVINEVLFNPRSGGVDFVEIYNKSDKYLDINDWEIGNIKTATGEPDDFNTVVNTNHLLAPGEFLVLTESPAILKADYPSGKAETFLEVDLPTYPNAEGGIIIKNAIGHILDRFDYSEDFHSLLLREAKGVSLERISLDRPTNDPNNWASAPQEVGFATPGYKNANQHIGESLLSKLSVEPQSFIPGGGETNNFTTITFDSSLSNARIDVSIYDVAGRKIKTLALGKTVTDGSFFRWDGSSDAGDMARVGIYLVQVEYFDASGQTGVVRTSVALGARF